MRRWGILLLFGLAWPLSVSAGALSVDEAKAAYVFNFIKFVEWPFSADAGVSAITICVMGDDAWGEVLAQLEGRKIGTHKLHIKQAMLYGDKLSSCQVMVIGSGMRKKIAALLSESGEDFLLSISDIEGFAEKGGCIGMIEREGHWLFEVNLESMRRKKLLLPGQVLNLAANVFGREKP